jgi:hypothetical protein
MIEEQTWEQLAKWNSYREPILQNLSQAQGSGPGHCKQASYGLATNMYVRATNR